MSGRVHSERQPRDTLEHCARVLKPQLRSSRALLSCMLPYATRAGGLMPIMYRYAYRSYPDAADYRTRERNDIRLSDPAGAYFTAV